MEQNQKTSVLPPPSPLAPLWDLDPKTVFLNHGSFGACPREVLGVQSRLRQRLERQPVQFFMRDLPDMLDEARKTLAEFVGAEADDLVFVPNATTGVNTVLFSLKLKPGDELLVTDHEYNACRNALVEAAARAGARVVVVSIPFPVAGPEAVLERLLEAVTPKTRICLFDHVTSPTGLVLPVAEAVRELTARGVETLIDGAHGPGMLPLDLRSLGAAYYTGNAHKWLCAPKGAAFLYVRPDCRDRVRPLCISHGANSPRQDRSRYQLEFDWTGTLDPSPFLCIAESIRWLQTVLPGGIRQVMDHNQALCRRGRHLLLLALDQPPPCPESMLGSMASVPLPPGNGTPPPSMLHMDPLQDILLSRYSIEVPVMPWPGPPRRLVRISAQLYNSEEQIAYLAEALTELLHRRT